MKIVILGNMGYVGTVVSRHLHKVYPTAMITGFDTGYFSSCLTGVDYLPELAINHQYFGDVRDFSDEILLGADVVIYLAAISNDPMGLRYERLTLEINHLSCIKIAKKARRMGVRTFVFASSCSVYGATMKKVTESSNVNPITAYAKSKVYAERDLRPLANEDFTISCLRFSTACGMSPRLRLDLVLNDFVASALSSHKINILSDGTPWRPLINVKDMALAIDWAIGRSPASGAFMAINVGSEEWNYQVKDLASAVAAIIPEVEVTINTSAPADKRSYQVDFGLYKIIAPHHQPQLDLATTVRELISGFEVMNFNDSDFRSSDLIRLNKLAALQEKAQLTEDLRWNFENQPVTMEK